MQLEKIYSENNFKKEGNSFFPAISFEVFPPKNDEDGQKTQHLLDELQVLKQYNPSLVSVTYGAGGTNVGKAFEVVTKIKNELNLEVMPHLTCVNSDRIFVKNQLAEFQKEGIENILALRGDMPQDSEAINFEFKHAADLVEFIKSQTDLSIGVAGYPEGHIDCDSLQKDIQYLKNKVDRGASAIFTQMCFDNDKLFKFIDMSRKSEILIPIIAGIMPILSFSSLEKMLTMGRVTIPEKLFKQIEKYQDDHIATREIGIEFASNQCKELILSGIKGLHFYTLNKSYSVSSILKNIL